MLIGPGVYEDDDALKDDDSAQTGWRLFVMSGEGCIILMIAFRTTTEVILP